MSGDSPSNAADLEAVSLVLQGDVDAYRRIVEKYRPVILRLCRSYLKSPEEAEDAAQEIFLRAYRSLSRFKLNRRFLNWLYTIAVNYLKSRYGGMRRLEATINRLRGERPEGWNTPEDQYLREELRNEIREAVRVLPPGLRDVTILYYIEELAVGDIAEITGLGVENIKSRLFRARRKMREYLEKMQPPGDIGGILP